MLDICLLGTGGMQPLPYRWAVYYTAVFAVLIFGVWGPGYSAANFVYFQF